MALSAATIRELEAEREKLLARVRAIGNVLNGDGGPTAAPQLELGDVQIASMGIRDAIREALRALKRARPAEVTKYLADRGYQTTGETPLPLRVSNEMWRMAKSEELVREGKFYRLA